MAKTYNQKMKLLYIVKILQEKTDENHYMTAAELIKELDKEGIRAERKSIYSDIQELTDFGYDIMHVKSRINGGYYMASRDFELAELKLLVDAVQASKFITRKKSLLRTNLRKRREIKGLMKIQPLIFCLFIKNLRKIQNLAQQTAHSPIVMGGFLCYD